ncbi:MAG: zinc ribbon domain-containing protein [Betaproteobacteria bacterium]|nr:zinc ribbon domain-containing protein [Betaproteobacteria bacterium]
MPTYEYLCGHCERDFTAVRRMAEASLPQPCPECGAPAPRAMMTAPAYAGMPAATRQAHAVNERSRHEPRSSAQAGHRHGPGCGCGSGPSRTTVTTPDGRKTFPTKRPWMISH